MSVRNLFHNYYPRNEIKRLPLFFITYLSQKSPTHFHPSLLPKHLFSFKHLLLALNLQIKAYKYFTLNKFATFVCCCLSGPVFLHTFPFCSFFFIIISLFSPLLFFLLFSDGEKLSPKIFHAISQSRIFFSARSE